MSHLYLRHRLVSLDLSNHNWQAVSYTDGPQKSPLSMCPTRITFIEYGLDSLEQDKGFKSFTNTKMPRSEHYTNKLDHYAGLGKMWWNIKYSLPLDKEVEFEKLVFQWGAFYLFIANFLATWNIGGTIELVVLLWLSSNI